MNKRNLLNSVDVGTAIFGYDASLKNITCNYSPNIHQPKHKHLEKFYKDVIWAIIKITQMHCASKRNTASLSLYENSYFLTEELSTRIFK